MSKLALRPFAGSKTTIPAYLRAEKRWAPWMGKLNLARGGKIDKIPYRADITNRGISTANPKSWFPFDVALKAFQESHGSFHGLGYVLTDQRGLVGIDLDGHVEDGVVSEEATRIINEVGSYAEISPSGTGIRIFALGEIDFDWTNHQVGIEVYQGDHPRFLTVTGLHLPGTPDDVVPAKVGSLGGLSDRHREKPQAERADTSVPRPMVLPLDKLPTLDELDLPPRARAFLAEGDFDGVKDRSRVLLVTAVALFKAGLNDVQVQSYLVNNPYAYEVALDHRRQRAEMADEYLWKHHTLQAQKQASNGLLTDADFENLGTGEDGGEDEVGADADDASGGTQVVDGNDEVPMFTAIPDEPKKFKFKLHRASDFAARDVSVDWLIEGVLPKAEMAVIFGASGSGKTFFALDMLVNLALGIDWCGHKVRVARSIVIIAAEGASGLRLRIRALLEHKGLSLEDVPLFVIDAAPNALEKEEVKALVESIRGQYGKIDLLVTDTLSQVTPGANENSSEDMGRALANFKTISRALGAMNLIIGHTGKDTGKGQRGWSGIRGALDVEIEVIRGISTRMAKITKMKDGDGEGKEYLFSLTTVNLTVYDKYEPDGLKDVTSCVCQFELDPMSIAISKEAEEKAKAAQRAKGRKDAPGADSLPDGLMWVRDILVAAQSPLQVRDVQSAWNTMWKEAHPAGKDEARRQAWKRTLELAKFAETVVDTSGVWTLVNKPDDRDI